jgi:hypothetical protein
MNLRAILGGIKGGKNHYFCDNRIPMQWVVLNHTDDLNNIKKMPIELQYAIAIHPSRFAALEELLNQGHGIAFGKQCQIPLSISQAVSNIADTHHGTLYPWLDDLVVNKAIPRWSESDFEEAEELGIDLKQQAHSIADHLKESIQIKLIQSPASQPGTDVSGLMSSIERDIQKIYSIEMANRLVSEHLNRSRDFNYLFLLSLVLFAPVAHVLEMLILGLGKIFALILPGLYYESLGLSRSYSLGAAKWQVVDNIKAKWPEVLILIISAVATHLLISNNLVIFAAISFAIAASSILVGKETRRLRKAKQVYEALTEQGKVSISSKTAWLKLYYGPLWWVNGLSIILGAIITVFVFTIFTTQLSNGWVLALLAMSPYLLFELLLFIWRISLTLRFKFKVKGLLSQAIIT